MYTPVNLAAAVFDKLILKSYNTVWDYTRVYYNLKVHLYCETATRDFTVGLLNKDCILHLPSQNKKEPDGKRYV